MNLIRVAAIVALLFGGQALGQSTMDFTVDLGGNNHVEDWEEFIAAPFTAADGTTTYASGETLTWSVDVSVSGEHSTGIPNGVSNFVFHLELYDTNTGQLVAVGATQPFEAESNEPAGFGFFSTINDGHADGFRKFIFPDGDPRESAAFARSFAPLLLGSGDGRVWDTFDNSGPALDRKQYPSASGWPLASTAPMGKLVGMGAGFSQYTLTGVMRTPGVGGIGGCALDIVAVAEGQLSLPDGCYQLKVCPGTGNNILRGDFDCGVDAPGSFAVAVDAANGDCIEFTVGDVGSCPAGPACECGDVGCPISVASRRTHGGSEAYDITLPGTEPRNADNGSPQVVFTYANAPADPGCGGVTIVNGDCLGTSVDGNELIVDVFYEANTCVTISVDADGCDPEMLLAHQGNVNGDADVNVIDLQDVKNVVFQPVDGNNYMKDVNCDGSLNVIDLQETKNNVFAPASCDN